MAKAYKLHGKGRIAGKGGYHRDGVKLRSACVPITDCDIYGRKHPDVNETQHFCAGRCYIVSWTSSSESQRGVTIHPFAGTVRPFCRSPDSSIQLTHSEILIHFFLYFLRVTVMPSIADAYGQRHFCGMQGFCPISPLLVLVLKVTQIRLTVTWSYFMINSSHPYFCLAILNSP
jgi:hypothetical protein